MTTATLPARTTEELDRELGRFFEVGQKLYDATGQNAMMPTCVVDQRWHDLIENGAIGAFVRETLGDNVTVDHIEAGGIDPINWFGLYEQLFGQVDPLWFTGTDGLDTELYGKYIAAGRPDMSWDCSPAYASVKMSWDCSPAYAKA